jgi:hypothetical protein
MEKRIKFKKEHHNWITNKQHYNPEVCDSILNKLFEIPKNTEKFTGVLSKETHPDAYKVIMSVEGYPIILLEDGKNFVFYISADKVLKKFGLPCYVRVEL